MLYIRVDLSYLLRCRATSVEREFTRTQVVGNRVDFRTITDMDCVQMQEWNPMFIRPLNPFIRESLRLVFKKTEAVLAGTINHQITAGKALTRYRSVCQSTRPSSLTFLHTHSFIACNHCSLIGVFSFEDNHTL